MCNYRQVTHHVESGGHVLERVTKESHAATQCPACTTMLTVQTDRCIQNPRRCHSTCQSSCHSDQQPEMDIKGRIHHAPETRKQSKIIHPINPCNFPSSIPFARIRSFKPLKMEKRKAEYNRLYDDNFWLNHRWDREVWCQSCKIYHGMREEAKEKCEERKRAAEEQEERLLEARRSKSPCYHDFQERPSSSWEESPEEIAPPSPPRVNHAAEAWAFYLEREEQKRKESAGTIELVTEPQRGSRSRLRAWIPVPQPREDAIPLPQYPYVTPSTFQYQPDLAPSPWQQAAQNRSLLNAYPGEQKSQNPAFTAPTSELPSGAVENFQRLPPINTELFGPMPDIPLRDHGFNSLPVGHTGVGPHFRPGPDPYSNLPDQNPPPAAVSNRRYDNQEEERFFSPYDASKPALPAVRKQAGRSRQAGISQTHAPSREQKSESTKRPSRQPKPLPLTAEQSRRLGTLRSRKRKSSLSVKDLLCAEEEAVDTVDFAHDQAPTRTSTRRRLTARSSSSAAITLSPYKSSSYTSNLIREEEEEEMEGVKEGADDEDHNDDACADHTVGRR